MCRRRDNTQPVCKLQTLRNRQQTEKHKSRRNQQQNQRPLQLKSQRTRSGPLHYWPKRNPGKLKRSLPAWMREDLPWTSNGYREAPHAEPRRQRPKASGGNRLPWLYHLYLITRLRKQNVTICGKIRKSLLEARWPDHDKLFYLRRIRQPEMNN